MRQRFDEKNKVIDEQTRLMEQTKKPKEINKQDMDPIWEQSQRGKDGWQTGSKASTQEDIQRIFIAFETPVYAISAIITITNAIDAWIDDYELDGGTIADRDTADGQIVADWGIRAKRRFTERNTFIKELQRSDAAHDNRENG